MVLELFIVDSIVCCSGCRHSQGESRSPSRWKGWRMRLTPVARLQSGTAAAARPSRILDTDRPPAVISRRPVRSSASSSCSNCPQARIIPGTVRGGPQLSPPRCSLPENHGRSAKGCFAPSRCLNRRCHRPTGGGRYPRARNSRSQGSADLAGSRTEWKGLNRTPLGMRVRM